LQILKYFLNFLHLTLYPLMYLQHLIFLLAHLDLLHLQVTLLNFAFHQHLFLWPLLNLHTL
jgi:hypothetical protein